MAFPETPHCQVASRLEGTWITDIELTLRQDAFSSSLPSSLSLLAKVPAKILNPRIFCEKINSLFVVENISSETSKQFHSQRFSRDSFSRLNPSQNVSKLFNETDGTLKFENSPKVNIGKCLSEGWPLILPISGLPSGRQSWGRHFWVHHSSGLPI